MAFGFMLHLGPLAWEEAHGYGHPQILLFSLCKSVQGMFTINGHSCPEFWVFHHHVMDSNSSPAEPHDADFLGVTLLLQIPQDSINLSRTERKVIRESRGPM